ncbi:MAG: hypothetical protein Kow0089_22390 [Desulfobulbaceae bacterium]
MGKALKWIITIVVALVVLFVIVLFSIPLFIDPNDYKDRISDTVREQTGRELAIPGDIRLSVSPSLKGVFSLGAVSLSSGSDFPGTDLLAGEQVEVSVSLWPLLRSRTLRINEIGLKGVRVNLVRTADGRANWESPRGKPAPAKGEVETAPPSAEQQKKKPTPLPGIDIGAVRIADINVTFDDRQAGRRVALTNFNLTTGRIAPGPAFPLEADFSLSIDDGSRPLTAAARLKGNFSFTIEPLRFTMDDLSLQSDLSGLPVNVARVDLLLSAVADLTASTVTVSRLRLQADETTMTGTAAITDLQKPAYQANLQIDRVDLDRLLPKKEGDTANRETAGASADPAAAVSASPAPGSSAAEDTAAPAGAEDPIIIPAALLHSLTFDAELKVGELKASGLTMSDLLVKAAGKDGRIRLDPFSAALYQGKITVTGEIDASSDPVTMRLTKVLENVETGPLFIDLTGKEEVKGTADIRAEITTAGTTKKTLTRNLNGTVALKLVNGEIAKLRIIDTIRLAKRLYEAGKGEAQAAATGSSSSGRPTAFADLSATGTITGGVIRNDDLKAASELMRVTGKGTVDLNTERIDYLLTVYLAKSMERDEEKDLVEMADTPIPYRVTGTFDKIEQSAALKEILKAGAVKLLSKELEKQLGGGKEGEDSSSGTGELINKGLKKLFGN